MNLFFTHKGFTVRILVPAHPDTTLKAGITFPVNMTGQFNTLTIKQGDRDTVLSIKSGKFGIIDSTTSYDQFKAHIIHMIDELDSQIHKV